MEGIFIPRPPILAGRANRARSKSLDGGPSCKCWNDIGSQNVAEWLQEVADIGNCTA